MRQSICTGERQRRSNQRGRAQRLDRRRPRYLTQCYGVGDMRRCTVESVQMSPGQLNVASAGKKIAHADVKGGTEAGVNGLIAPVRREEGKRVYHRRIN